MKKTVLLTSILLALISIVGCNENDKSKVIEIPTSALAQFPIGFEVINQNCIACHSLQPQNENAVAPSFIEIKKAYQGNTNDLEKFQSDMSNFLVNPNATSAKMPEDIKRFGLMPNLGYDKEQYEAIATYLYYSNIEDPKWYENNFEIEKTKYLSASKDKNIDYLAEGKKIAMSTKSVLGKNLLNAIQTKGTTGALDFCNERAIVITDSMAMELNANIKRVSDNNRNPNNSADKNQLEYILQAKNEIKETGSALPKMQNIDNKMVGYYPIITNGMCLQCHGQPEDEISIQTLASIQEHYPSDKAQGYASDQLRGIWVVEMDIK